MKTLKKFIEELLEFDKEHPGLSEALVVYSSDAEANEIRPVGDWYPQAGHYDPKSGEFLSQKELDDLAEMDDGDVRPANAVLIN